MLKYSSLYKSKLQISHYMSLSHLPLLLMWLRQDPIWMKITNFIRRNFPRSTTFVCCVGMRRCTGLRPITWRRRDKPTEVTFKKFSIWTLVTAAFSKRRCMYKSAAFTVARFKLLTPKRGTSNFFCFHKITIDNYNVMSKLS